MTLKATEKMSVRRGNGEIRVVGSKGGKFLCQDQSGGVEKIGHQAKIGVLTLIWYDGWFYVSPWLDYSPQLFSWIMI